MDKLISWDELVELIGKLHPEQRKMPVLSQNKQTGAFFGFTGITFSDPEDNLPDMPMLDDDNNWLYINTKDELTRSRYQPADMKGQEE